ncbi:hypothetical protein [Pseudoclavibacter terrae]|uniref:hypothetical protein n=1 Tax=Pseudoclavibacter terrae TaxID=1530195 RepID=UPI00232F4AA5|nr:hypothetical protein [Pseudoclavibacter terrae]
MSSNVSIEEAVERAKRAEEDRIEAIRALATARQSITDAREDADREIAELQAHHAELMRYAEAADVRAYSAAVKAGWSADALRDIGFAEPEKKKRVRARSARKPKVAATSSQADTNGGDEQHADQQ